MTRDDEKLFCIFEEKLRVLIEQHASLKAQNQVLEARLASASEALAQSEAECAKWQVSLKVLTSMMWTIPATGLHGWCVKSIVALLCSMLDILYEKVRQWKTN